MSKSPYINHAFWRVYANLYWPNVTSHAGLDKFASYIQASLPQMNGDEPLRILALGFGFGGVELPILHHLRNKMPKQKFECVLIDRASEPLLLAKALLDNGLNNIPNSTAEVIEKLCNQTAEPGNQKYYSKQEPPSTAEVFHFLQDDLEWEPPTATTICPAPSNWKERLYQNEGLDQVTFHIVIASFVLFHIPYWRRVLYDALGMMVDGGVFIHGRSEGDEAIFEGRFGRSSQKNNNAVKIFKHIFENKDVEERFSTHRGASASRPFVIDEYLCRLESFGLTRKEPNAGQSDRYSIENHVDNATYGALLETEGFSTFARISKLLGRADYEKLYKAALQRADLEKQDKLEFEFIWSLHTVSPGKLLRCPLHPDFDWTQAGPLEVAYQIEYARGGASSVENHERRPSAYGLALTRASAFADRLNQQELLHPKSLSVQFGFLDPETNEKQFYFAPSFMQRDAARRERHLRELYLYLSLSKISTQQRSNTDTLLLVALEEFVKPCIFSYVIEERAGFDIEHRSNRDYEEIRFYIPASNEPIDTNVTINFTTKKSDEHTKDKNFQHKTLFNMDDFESIQGSLNKVATDCKKGINEDAIAEGLARKLGEIDTLSEAQKTALKDAINVGRFINLRILTNTGLIVLYPATFEVSGETLGRDVIIVSYEGVLPDAEISGEFKKFNNIFEKIRFERQENEIKRHGLRAAVAAIMGRNMSHNIGSHVLARYSSEIHTDLKPVDSESRDHRGDFLAYLQRRTDFIAEISTSDQSHWAQSLSLKEQIDKLNWEALQKHSKFEDGQGRANPILLRYITGNGSLTASVNYEGNEQELFACPGGEVGVHALFVILENIIRNSARHSGENWVDKRVVIRVQAEDDSVNDQLIALTIIDEATKLDKLGYHRNGNKKRLARPEFNAQSSVDQDVTPSVIELALREPFLMPEGSINPKNWGVREMQICAHYLRGHSLSELGGEKAISVLHPYIHHLGDDKYCLAYRILLRKPKNVLILTKDSSTTDLNLPKGVLWLSMEDAQQTYRQQSRQLRDYDFCIYENTEGVEDVLKTLDATICLRRIEMSKKAIDAIAATSLDDMLTTLHRALIDHYLTTGNRETYWGKGPIVGVYGNQEARSASELREDGRIIHITAPHNWVTQVLEENPLPLREVQGFRALDARGSISVAWLDHATDAAIWGDGAHSTFKTVALGPLPQEIPCHGTEYFTGKWLAVEFCWSNSHHQKALSSLEQAQELTDRERRIWSELICAALPRVIVLDERVQSRRLDKIRDVSLCGYWPCVGIWSPFMPEDIVDGAPGEQFAKKIKTPRCDLDQPDFDDVKAFLVSPSLDQGQGHADYVVIHLTILEKLHASRPGDETLDATLDALFSGSKAENARRIVVSGRGVPHQLRHSDNSTDHDRLTARHIPVSALLEYLVQHPSKLGLMQLLWTV